MDLAERLKDLAISRSGFVFDPMSGVTFSVNGTGQAILHHLRDGLTPDAIEAALARDFALSPDDDPARDVREFLLLLADQGIAPRDARTSVER